MDQRVTWLLESDEPWTRYRTLVDILKYHKQGESVIAARQEMVLHPLVEGLIHKVTTFYSTVLKRHNDAKHPLYALSTLADFGLTVDDDERLANTVDQIKAYRDAEGMPLTLLGSSHFRNKDETIRTWMLCDVPTVVYCIQKLDPGTDVNQTLAKIANLVSDNGWHCIVSPELGKFRGPGRKDDPCPIANIYSLKALSCHPDFAQSDAAHAGTNMLLLHWQHQREVKHYLFGIGTQFRRLKYPFIWYDLLHAVDVLSRFPWVYEDERFQDMLYALVILADDEGRFTAGSMYRAWKDWSFANKKQPSPWLTYLVNRILIRVGEHTKLTLYK